MGVNNHLSVVSNDYGREYYGGGNGTGDPPNVEIEKRLAAVEQGIIQINATLPHLASQSDLSDAKVDIIKWLVGTLLVCTGIAVAVMKLGADSIAAAVSHLH